MYRFLKNSEAMRILSAILPLLMIFLLSNSAVSFAAEKHHHEAHVHGLGQLNVALDDMKLLLEFTSPAANIIGFEHPPGNTQEKQAVREATALLEAGEKLFIISPEAQCTLRDANVESSLSEEEHDKHHTSPKHGEHNDEHAQVHSEDDVHSEFASIYHFLCQTPAKIKSIDVQLFSHFPGLEELEVQLLMPKGQTATELSPKRHKIAL